MKIFLDANVLFSASNGKSNIHRFLNFLQKHYTLFTSPYAFSEAERNILLKRPEWEGNFKKLIKKIAIVSDAALRMDVKLIDKDRPILGAAIAAKCDYLLTGDKKDFGHLYGGRFRGVTVVNYMMLLELALWEYPDIMKP